MKKSGIIPIHKKLIMANELFELMVKKGNLKPELIKVFADKLKNRQKSVSGELDKVEFNKQKMSLDSYSLMLKLSDKGSGLLIIYKGETKIASVNLWGKYLRFTYCLAKKRILDREKDIPDEAKGWVTKKEIIEKNLWDTPGAVGSGKSRTEQYITADNDNLKDKIIQKSRKFGYRIGLKNIIITGEIGC